MHKFLFFLRRMIDYILFFFFLIDPAPPEIYPLPLPAALPISLGALARRVRDRRRRHLKQLRNRIADPRRRRPARAAHLADRLLDTLEEIGQRRQVVQDRKSTRLNSSHSQISYAVFCLKQKK